MYNAIYFILLLFIMLKTITKTLNWIVAWEKELKKMLNETLSKLKLTPLVKDTLTKQIDSIWALFLGNTFNLNLLNSSYNRIDLHFNSWVNHNITLYLKLFHNLEIDIYNWININDLYKIINYYNSISNKKENGAILDSIIKFLLFQILLYLILFLANIEKDFKLVDKTSLDLKVIIKWYNKAWEDLMKLFYANHIPFISKFSDENKKYLLWLDNTKLAKISNSNLFKTHDLNDINPILLKILIENHSIFLWKSEIKFENLYKILFNLSQNKNNNEILEKINLYLIDLFPLNLSQESVIMLINNVINTWKILNIETINEVKWKTSTNIDDIIENLISNPDYIEEIRKKELIAKITDDLKFIDDNNEWKNELTKLLKDPNIVSYDNLKISQLSIYTKYNLDTIIAENKRILWNYENDLEKISILFLLNNIFFNFNNKLWFYLILIDINNEILYKLMDLFEKINIPEDISIENFKTLVNILLENEEFYSDIINSEEKINFNDLKDLVNVEKLKNTLNLTLKTLLSDDEISLIWRYTRNTKMLSEIITLLKKIPEALKLDLVIKLSLKVYNLNDLKNLVSIIWYFNYINILSLVNIAELFLWLDVFDRFIKLKNILTNKIILNFTNIVELKDLIINFLKSWNIDTLNLSDSWENTSSNALLSNEIDLKIYDIFQNWTTEQKEKLWRIIWLLFRDLIQSLHPSIITSTSNSWFWPWSWSYIDYITSYIFKKLQKKSDESIDEYLYRILNINLKETIGLENINDINGNYHLKVIFWLIEELSNLWIVEVLELITSLFDKIQLNDSNTDLTNLKNHYSNTLSNELKKLKRSLEQI